MVLNRLNLINLLSMKKKFFLLLEMKGEALKETTVADPSRKLGRIHLEISGMDVLAIDLVTGNFAGQSVKAVLNLLTVIRVFIFTL